MKIKAEKIEIRGEDMQLTNLRAIYWKREKALILSDLHIGKTAHFRKYGIPVTDKVFQRDLEHLKLLFEKYNPLKMIVVGDLYHAESNNDTEFFAEWLSTYKGLEVVLIKGNHDRILWKNIEGIKFESTEFLDLSPFRFIHNPLHKSDTSFFMISGHIHPGVLIKGRAKQKIKLPCYQLNEHKLILPAFSRFTGLNMASQSSEDVHYAITEDNIFKL